MCARARACENVTSDSTGRLQGSEQVDTVNEIPGEGESPGRSDFLGRCQNCTRRLPTFFPPTSNGDHKKRGPLLFSTFSGVSTHSRINFDKRFIFLLCVLRRIVSHFALCSGGTESWGNV